VEYSQFRKDVNTPELYLSYYSNLRKTVKWSNVVLYMIVPCFIHYALTENLIHCQIQIHHETTTDWISEAEKGHDTSTNNPTTNQHPTLIGPTKGMPGSLSTDFSRHEGRKKIITSWEGK
jgi:hypothetical protein